MWFQNLGLQNVRNKNGLSVVLGIANHNGNGNVVATRAEGNANGNNENQMRCYNYQRVDHYARNCIVQPRKRDAAYLQTQFAYDEIKEVNANYYFNDNLHQAQHQLSKEKSTVYYLQQEKKNLKSDFKIREDELVDKQIQLEQKIQELDNILVKTGQSIQMMHMLSPNQTRFITPNRKWLWISKIHLLKQAQQKQHSLYNGKVLLVKHDPPAVYDSEETLQLAQETNESLAKHKALEYEIDRLLRAVVSQDIMSIVQNHSVVDTSNLQTELDPYKDMQQKIEQLQAQLGDLKGKSKDTLCVSDTLDRLSQKLEDENMKHKPNVKKSKKLGSNERLASPRPSKPRTCLRWLPTRRIFDLCGKITASSNTESESDIYVCDNASASNPQEPTSKGFPSSTSFLDRFTRLWRQNTFRDKKYAELTKQEKRQDDCDVQELNIVLQGTEFSYQERKCKLYNEFDKFTSIKGESLHEYYLHFAQIINDMHTIGMTMQQVQVNTKFLNALQPEWSKFVTDVKLAKNIYPSSLALVANHQTQLNSVLFLPGDDPIACLNKAMTFMSTVVASRFPSTNNQLRTSSNLRNQATIPDGKEDKGEGHMTRQCTKPKRPRNSELFKEKTLLVQTYKSSQVLDEEQLAFLVDPRIPNSQAV
ncbi:hypothetical protein Tco_0318664 [Tanacetum coccineum]